MNGNISALFTTCVFIPGVARGQPTWLLPSCALRVIYLVVGLSLAACLVVVALYGSLWPRNVVLMWLISTFSAFLTSALLLEPLKVSSRVLLWNEMISVMSSLKLDSKEGSVLMPPISWSKSRWRDISKEDWQWALALCCREESSHPEEGYT